MKKENKKIEMEVEFKIKLNKDKDIKELCAICDKKDFKNRKDNHHIIPRKKDGLGRGRVWLCTECHTMLHIAESKGLCELPSETDRKYYIENSRTYGLMKKAERLKQKEESN